MGTPARRYSWREWTPKDWAVAVVVVALGFALSAVVPGWLWAFLVVVAYIWWFALGARRPR